jgi:predicted RNA binding protein YcfA (HicA-like mRNA interferase family)
MKLRRDVSGERLVEALCRRWRYSMVHQSGSHIIIETEEPSHQRIAVPNHNALRIGTLNSILRAVSNHKGVTRDEIVATLR